jgi:quercetin dioxygenase-like cupin family protein
MKIVGSGIVRIRHAAVGVTVLIVGAILNTASAQQAANPRAKGPNSKPLVSVDLASEIENVQGRVLRMQLTTYEPGASNTPHSHKDRPEVVYVLSGTIIDHRGDVAKEYGPGESFTAGKDTTHWMENKASVPAVLVVSTIAKKE